MQYVSGKTLRDAVAELLFEEKLALMRDVRRAVHAAHQTGLVHRDIKPQKHPVDAARTGRGHSSPTSVSRATCNLPERRPTARCGNSRSTWRRSRPMETCASLDARTDRVRAGATLYEVLTARPPFEGGSPAADPLPDDP